AIYAGWPVSAALGRGPSPGLRSGRHAHPSLLRHRDGGAAAGPRSRQPTPLEPGDAHVVTLQSRGVKDPVLVQNIWLAGDAVLIAPVSGHHSLLAGNLTGIFA